MKPENDHPEPVDDDPPDDRSVQQAEILVLRDKLRELETSGALARYHDYLGRDDVDPGMFLGLGALHEVVALGSNVLARHDAHFQQSMARLMAS